MGRDDLKLIDAKKSYRSAQATANPAEEARWANVVGNLLKDRGEYEKALCWLHIDYDLSVKHLSPNHCLASCQSLGEVYYRLQNFKEALLYQKKHLELAEDAGDLVEQQRANTQLGRTYHDMFLKSEDQHLIQNAKRYFNSAMKLARTIKENPPTNKSSFVKEFIDAINNVGLLELDLDNVEEAEKILTEGLDICDLEEVNEHDDGRTRLHHNLGKVYTELRLWGHAREHIEKDIEICRHIGHCEGEAKGYVNLGELHYRVQKYDEALLCYQKALNLAKLMEDENALVHQIEDNMEIVKKADKVMHDMKVEEQNLKKLKRKMARARGTKHERNSQSQQCESLDCLIDKSQIISAWPKVLEFAKMKKKIASELCDRVKIGDSFLTIGESYMKLRKFRKAFKWCMKSLKLYESIGNLEGQALVQNHIGNVLDSEGDFKGALKAFKESYRLALEAKDPSIQLTALENMHYSNLNRFDDVEETRRLKLLIDKLKQQQQNNEGLESEKMSEDRCSESGSEGSSDFSDNMSETSGSRETRQSNSSRPQSLNCNEGLNDDAPLISLVRSSKTSSKMKSAYMEKSEQAVLCRKRVRLVLSDDEDEMCDVVECPIIRTREVATSNEVRTISNTTSPSCKFQDVSAFTSNCTPKHFNTVTIEESSSSSKPRTLDKVNQEGTGLKATSSASGSKCHYSDSEHLLHKNDIEEFVLLTSDDKHNQCITFEIAEDLIKGSSTALDKLNIGSLKVQLACLYYLQLPMEKKLVGLLPIIENIKFGEKVIESMDTMETLQGHMGKVKVKAFIGGWVQKPLISFYLDCCYKLSETPSIKLVKKLYDLEVPDDEVTVSECELRDLSIAPLINALHAYKTFAMLDLSHNLLGNGTMEKLQQVLTLSGQKYGGLTLDLHCNRFGPTALLQICECSLLFTRLEVLNISGNRLTDACASYLSTILENCKGLCCLSVERCSITSRTIQKIADALSADTVLEQLCIGYNSPISGSALTNLLVKLGTLKRFSKLNIKGLKLSKNVVDSLCQLAKTLSLSVLMLGETGIGLDGALLVTDSLFHGGIEEFVKLDLSYCGVTCNYVLTLSTNSSMICGILELNLSGNPIMPEGSNALSSLLLNPQCCLKVLVLQKCQLGVAGVLRIIQALAGNGVLEELNLANNADFDMAEKESVGHLQRNLDMPESSSTLYVPNEANQLEVADSEDDEVGVEPAAPAHVQTNSPSTDCQFLQEISTAIDMAMMLRFLDLSENGLSTQSAQMLYSVWSRSRSVSARRHIKDKTIHLFVEGIKCCVKPCCRAD